MVAATVNCFLFVYIPIYDFNYSNYNSLTLVLNVLFTFSWKFHSKNAGLNSRLTDTNKIYDKKKTYSLKNKST